MGVQLVLTPHEYYAAIVAACIAAFALGMIVVGVWTR